MSRKTTKAARNAIARWDAARDILSQQLHVKQHGIVEYHSDWIKNHTSEWFIGMLEGAKSMTENVIMDEGCWHGFTYLGEDGNQLTLQFADGKQLPLADHPEYREWRVRFFTKD